MFKGRLTGSAVLIGITLLIFSGCGGGGTGTPTTTTATTTTTPTVVSTPTTDATSGSTSGTTETKAAKSTTVNTLSDLPTLNVSDFITKASAGNVGKAVKVSKAVIGSAGTFSEAGCECRQIKKDLLNQGREVEATNCLVQAIGKAKNLKIAQDDFSYYKLNFSANNFVLVRVGNFKSGGATTFKMDICQPDASQALNQTSSFETVISETGVSGTFIDFTKPDPAKPDIDQVKFSFNIDGYDETAAGFSFNTANFSSQFLDRFGEGKSELVADAKTAVNVVSADIHNKANANNQVDRLACRFNGTEGASKFSTLGTFPSFAGAKWVAQGLDDVLLNQLGFVAADKLCPSPLFDETKLIGIANSPILLAALVNNLGNNDACPVNVQEVEAFKIATDGNQETATVAANSSFLNAVNAATLNTDAVQAPIIAFATPWTNCELPQAGAADVDISDVDLSTCTALNAQVESSFEESCELQKGSAKLVEGKAVQ